MSTTDFGSPDVIVVGAGNAACCAAFAARESGANVVMLEAAPLEDCGGNSRYTGGLMRVVYNGVDDLAQIIPDLTEQERKTHDYGSYTADAYYDDMGRITQYRTDPDLCQILIERSFETLVWLRKKGVKFHRRVNHGMTHSLYISDPNGYGVEVLYELPREVWGDNIQGALDYAEPVATEGDEAFIDDTDYPKFGKAKAKEATGD